MVINNLRILVDNYPWLHSTPIGIPLQTKTPFRHMDTALEKLLRATGPDSIGYRPVIFNLPADTSALMSLLSEPGMRITDRMEAQLQELVKSMQPQSRLTGKELQDAINRHLGGSKLSSYGSWVYYPWRRELVHLLPEAEFARVRTDRNRNKITREEQAVLSTKKIGVIGLSVGQSVSVTMALERSFGEIRLADFDTLDLSNLNRIRTGVHHLGMNKAVITAREIAEIDPYLKVTCFTDGLTRENMDAFFTEGGKLDILVEECDSVDIKILARQKAKELRIPVVMDMSDRGCLDVERFDLEPNRPIMHGWIDHLDLEAAKRPMTAEEKVPFMIPITGVETLSPRMKASVIELGQTISTWPQLATSVVLGGALAGDAVRRICLRDFKASGRWFVDLEEQVADPASEVPAGSPVIEHFQLTAGDLEGTDRFLGAAPEGAIALAKGQVEQLVQAGGMAPSMGNMQPWAFMWHGNRLLLFRDEARSMSFWDPQGRMAHLALGACMENVVLKAHEIGLEVRQNLGTGRLVAAFSFFRSEGKDRETHGSDRLAPFVAKRSTDRRIHPATALPDGFLARLAHEAAPPHGCQIHFLEDKTALAKLAGLCATAERLRILNPGSHHEYFKGQLRWTPEDAMEKGDGIDIATLAMQPMEQAALKMMADPRAMALSDQWGAGRAIGLKAAFLAASAPAMVLVSHQHDTLGAQLEAGRTVQRFWLAATAEGLAVQPMPAAVLAAHGLRERINGLRPQDLQELELAPSLEEIWQLEGLTPLFMARLSNGMETVSRSRRRSVADLICEPFPTPVHL